jgi:hypothetical protein
VTQPSGGFRVAEGFVELKTRVDSLAVNRAGAQAGEDFGERMVQSARDRIDRRKDLVSQELKRVGERAGRDAGQALADGFFRDQAGRLRDRRGRFAALTDGLDEVSRDAGRQFSSGFIDLVTGNMSGALKSPGVRTALIGGVAALAPLMGAALSGAIIGGIGLMGIGGVLAAAFSDAEGPARKAASDLGKRIMQDWRQIGDMFQGEATNVIGVLSDEWDKRMPDLMRGLESLRGFIEPIARGVAGFLGEIVSGLAHVMSKAGPILLMISQELPETGQAIRTFLELISEDTDGALMGLKVVFELLQGSIIAFGHTLRTLSVIFEGTVGNLNALHDHVIKNNSALVQMMGIIPMLAEAGDRLSSWMDRIKDQSEDYEGAARASAQATDIWGNSLNTLRGKTMENVTVNDLMNASMTESIRVMGELSRVLDVLNGGAIELREAESNYQQAVDETTEAIKKKVSAINLETELGRTYDAQLRGIATASQRVAEAAYKQAAASGNVAAGELLAAQAMKRGRDQLIASAQQMGMSRSAAIRYADQIMKIPKKWLTFVDVTNVPQSTADMAAYKRFINSIPRDVYTYFHNNATSGFGAAGDSWGAVEKMAQGGLMAGVVNKPTIIFGERNTDEEAYIPKRGNLMRSRGILSTAASWLGMDVIPQNQNRNARMPHVGQGGSNMPNRQGGWGDQPVYVVVRMDFPTGHVTQIVEGVITRRPDVVDTAARKGSSTRSTFTGFGR